MLTAEDWLVCFVDSLLPILMDLPAFICTAHTCDIVCIMDLLFRTSAGSLCIVVNSAANPVQHAILAWVECIPYSGSCVF